ncbi:MAG: phage tail protein [Tenericutes bacterium HGW-Tenericutes-1]|jgi:hypothetical protein|nr:MAG: phage tail protein [Tenericutes bacterium HGW-Tenericutes-1]PKM95807.1 MAG: phage tail protein [Firmicutes bacterium HGW-Firmicutes-1]
MGVNAIPDKIVNYNLYNDEEKLFGVGGEITLPNFEAMTETISGAGILGEIESPNLGHFGSLPLEIPLRMLDEQSMKIVSKSMATITLRASEQSYDVSSGVTEHRGLKIVTKGIPKGIDLGTAGVGKPTETKVTLELVYIKIMLDNKVLLELDKINFVFIVDGKDLLADVKNQI